MRLQRFQVLDFRSVDDSGWIDAEQVTALVGTNESGKTNILLPLWKLNGGEIDLAADYPRKLYATARHECPPRVFIRAVFAVGEELATSLSKTTGADANDLRETCVARRFDGSYVVTFPLVPTELVVGRNEIDRLLAAAETELSLLTPQDAEVHVAKAAAGAISRARGQLKSDSYNAAAVADVIRVLDVVSTDGSLKDSSIVPRFQRLVKDLTAIRDRLEVGHPDASTDAATLVTKALPKFVYYSNYGNLDSEIYLPHVIENLNRKDLGSKEQAKARTLRVLFKFVGLKPEEIRDLGKEGGTKEQNQIEAIAEKKTERTILLDSASARLTEGFKRFWKQGDYAFDIRADGDHLRIWVSDSLRPQRIELEGRSAGLQWFLSFFLVFLVESEEEHKGAILLLDEPGHTLHPAAQHDLSAFFQGLSETNQIIYTTHSPFLVDADHIDRARKVFVDSVGTTRVTADLGAEGNEAARRGPGYAVYAAIGMGVAESLLLGCDPVIVEGASDQHYLSAIKTTLIAAGRLKPGRELVFPPAGGAAKGVKVLAGILLGRDGGLPAVLLDSDPPGQTFAKLLRDELYSENLLRVHQVGQFVSVPNAEVEDLIPNEVMIHVLDRWQRGPEKPFADFFEKGKAIVPQIEAWAKTHGIELPRGWKANFARRVKSRILEVGHARIGEEALKVWSEVIAALQQQGEGE